MTEIPVARGIPPRLLPVLAVIVAASAPHGPHHPDEDQYAWSAAHYGNKVLAGDFGEHGTHVFLDPGWDPSSYWGRSMGTRAILATALATPWAQAPALPYSFGDPALQAPDARLDRDSLVVLPFLC